MGKIPTTDTFQIATFERMKPMKRKAYSYIRFSTKQQIDNDSLRRQSKLAEEYCNDPIRRDWLELDLTESMQDLGVPGYKGKNIKDGSQLKDFLTKVQSGKIPSDSYLLIENIDRFSRAKPTMVYDFFKALLNEGITIVTLEYPIEEYTIESLDDHNLERLIGEIRRANKESKRKEIMISKAWAQKRQDVRDKKRKYTAKCPIWLKLEYTTDPITGQEIRSNKFTPNDKMIEAVRFMFKQKLANIGPDKIAEQLNNIMVDGEYPFRPPETKRNPSGTWRGSTILTILKNPAVIGEIQMKNHGANDGPREKDHFPPIISEEDFLQVQAQIEFNRDQLMARGGGQKGHAVYLFRHITKCGLCGSNLEYVNKGQKTGHYLYCKRRKLKLEDNVCNARHLKYYELENIILNDLEELQDSDIFPNPEEIALRERELKKKIASNEHQSQDLQKQMFTYENELKRIKYEALGTPGNVARYLKWLAEGDEQLETLKKEYFSMLEELESIKGEGKQVKKKVDVITSVRQLMENAKTNQEKVLIRVRLQMEIRKLIKEIVVFPLMEPYQEVNEVDPGIYITMRSKYIRKVQIYFHAPVIKMRDKVIPNRILLLKSGFDAN